MKKKQLFPAIKTLAFTFTVLITASCFCAAQNEEGINVVALFGLWRWSSKLKRLV